MLESVPVAKGTRIGRYEIRSLVGSGGMGEVYRAFDPMLGREVALKIMNAASSEKLDWIARFEREARAVGGLSHPNIVSVHDFGIDGGIRYLVTELLVGETLRTRVGGGPVSLETMIDFAQQAARGLAAAHARGVVHRDLKPANLFVTEEGLLKILDFGVAKVVGEGEFRQGGESLPPPSLPKPDELTASGDVMGTIGYMSPEQVRGRPTDARSDLFSLGTVIYELVTGRRPFQGDTGVQIALSVLEDEPPPMMTASGMAPPELEGLVRQCLRKLPEDRFQSAREVSLALDSLASSSRATTWRGRRARLRLALAAVPLFVLAGATYYWVGVERTPIDSIAVLPVVNGANDPNAEYLADGITETVIDRLSQLPKLRVMARSTVFRYKGREADPLSIGRELGVHTVLLGKVMQQGDKLSIRTELVNVTDGARLWGEHYDGSLSNVLVVQQDIAREISEKLRLRLTGEEKKRLAKQETNSTEAYQLYWEGQYIWRKGPLYLGAVQYGSLPDEMRKAEQYFQRAIELDPSYAPAHIGLSKVYSLAASRGLLPPNETWSKVEAAATKALELDSSLAHFYYHLLAGIEFYDRRDWATAERAIKHAIELNPNNAEVRAHHSVCLMLMGRADDARAELRGALAIDPLSPRYNALRGEAPLIVPYWARQNDELIERCQQAIGHNPADAFPHDLLGNAYEQKGMYQEAIAEWRKAMLLAHDDELVAIVDRAHAPADHEHLVRLIWQKRLERLNGRAARGEYVAAGHFARAYARLRENRQALLWLEEASKENNRLALEATVDPVFDVLRTEPAFVELCRHIRLAR